MSIQLPKPASEEEFDALDRKAPIFLEAIHYGFGHEVGSLPISATTDGSYPVFYIGSEYVAKLFAPLHDDFFRTELAVLRMLNRLAIGHCEHRALMPRDESFKGSLAILLLGLHRHHCTGNRWATAHDKEMQKTQKMLEPISIRRVELRIIGS